MGNSQSSSRTLVLDNIEAHLSQCIQLSTKSNGILTQIAQSMEIYIM